MRALPDLIAVHGAKRAGKGTISRRLHEAHGYIPVKFAEALKDMVSCILARGGLSPETVERCVEGDLKEVPLPILGGKSTRFAQMTMGTEWRDVISTNMWLDIACNRIRTIRARGDRASVDDLRFPHELERMENERAVLWMVETDRLATSHGSSSGLPFDVDPYGKLDLGADALQELSSVLLRHCGFAPSEIHRALFGDLRDVGVPILGGKTPAFVLSALDSVWRPLMESPSVPFAANVVHASERGLPSDRFHGRFRNDGTIADLDGAIDLALAATRQTDGY